MPRRSYVAATLALTSALIIAGCVQIFQKVRVQEVPTPTANVAISTPIKAHLVNGHVVVFQNGAVYDGVSRILSGVGTMYDLHLATSSVARVPIDSVAAMETFDKDVQELPSVIATVGATAFGVFVASAAAVAIFGSCPTIYTSDGKLQSETFSNSVSRLMEVRDVDRLSAQPDRSGLLRLEIRNEALETHYLNHLQLLSVTHEPDEYAVPQRNGNALLLGGLRTTTATDRAGNDVTNILRDEDDLHYRTDKHVLAAVSESDMRDYLDLTIPSPKGDTASLFIRGRSSLLTTVLLYDFLLSQGPETADYVGVNLESIGEAMALGALFRKHLGIRVYVFDDGDWRYVDRIGTSGPVAWEEMGVRIPVPDSESLRIRLEFLADSWRFDQIQVADRVHEVTVLPIPIDEIIDYSPAANSDVRNRIADPDGKYHITFPGQSYSVVFDTNPTAAPGMTSTYFLAAQGYYTEWIRRDWFDRPHVAFDASDRTLMKVIEKWQDSGGWYERHFFTSRVPVDLSR
jgi:hypothetical protein